MLGEVSLYSRIYLAYGYTDLRFGIDGLARVVQNHFELDPFQKGTLFLFCGRRTDQIKSLLWEGDGCLHELLYGYHVLQADEPPVEATKDGRAAGAKSYMWIYRTGKSYAEAIVLYEYQKDRRADHSEEFLKGFQGICVTDGYQAYCNATFET